jgi:3-hydroxyacyl-CoA dehydrogenase
VAGAGLIGRSWAIVFARAGLAVALYDGIPGVAARARTIIADELETLTQQGAIGSAADALGRIRVADTLPEAVEGAALVQECASETIEAKLGVFAELDRAAGRDALLASSTSGIVASRFTSELPGRARCFVAHPVNPPHLVPLVELVGAPWTSAAVIDRAKTFYTAIGQVPIVVRAEIDGFILNRLQAALVSEAFRLVGGGYVSPQDLDKTVKDGLGLRWSFMGPFETIELNAPEGIPDYCARYGPTLAQLSNAPPETYGGANLDRVMVQWHGRRDQAAVTERMRWRNRRLAALRLHKQSQPEE